mmetsp:Transcript_52547/g.105287  ORF Transcript_52547/g.105287 Transcript_52547/m.105287 type:complete len:137 (-) Transcript_52547:336-746(-)
MPFRSALSFLGVLVFVACFRPEVDAFSTSTSNTIHRQRASSHTRRGKHLWNYHSEHENPAGIKVGDEVRVTSSPKLMHLPKFKKGFEPHGLQGTVKKLVLFSSEGIEVSTNRPVVVSFTDPKFSAHFEFCEVEKAA